MSSITLSHLEDMFANIQARTNWDVDGEMVWGYFFTDPDRTKLEPVAEHLASNGYRVVDIYEAEDARSHFLHVERIEKHTPQSLDARNRELEELAGQFGLACYDGMECGPVSDEQA